MQYAIYDDINESYFGKDGIWIFTDRNDPIIEIDDQIELFKDDDKAVARIAELKKDNSEAEYTLHSFDFERVYFVRPVVDQSVIDKIRTANGQ